MTKAKRVLRKNKYTLRYWILASNLIDFFLVAHIAFPSTMWPINLKFHVKTPKGEGTYLNKWLWSHDKDGHHTNTLIYGGNLLIIFSRIRRPMALGLTCSKYTCKAFGVWVQLGLFK